MREHSNPKRQQQAHYFPAIRQKRPCSVVLVVRAIRPKFLLPAPNLSELPSLAPHEYVLLVYSALFDLASEFFSLQSILFPGKPEHHAVSTAVILVPFLAY